MRAILLTPSLSLCLAVAEPAWSQSDAEARIKRLVETNTHGQVVPDAVEKTPVAGVYAVRMGLDIMYVDAEGRYAFLEGHLLDLTTKQDLTQQRLEAAARIDFRTLPLDLALRTVRGSGRRQLAVFEDPTCPYCRALHKLLDQLDDVTIYTFPYPVLSADSDAKARAALCSRDRDHAWQELVVTGKAPDSRPCTTQVDKVIALGNRLNVRGTPTVFFQDGRRAQGAVPPDQFIGLLKQSQP